MRLLMGLLMLVCVSAHEWSEPHSIWETIHKTPDPAAIHEFMGWHSLPPAERKSAAQWLEAELRKRPAHPA